MVTVTCWLAPGIRLNLLETHQPLGRLTGRRREREIDLRGFGTLPAARVGDRVGHRQHGAAPVCGSTVGCDRQPAVAESRVRQTEPERKHRCHAVGLVPPVPHLQILRCIARTRPRSGSTRAAGPPTRRGTARSSHTRPPAPSCRRSSAACPMDCASRTACWRRRCRPPAPDTTPRASAGTLSSHGIRTIPSVLRTTTIFCATPGAAVSARISAS